MSASERIVDGPRVLSYARRMAKKPEPGLTAETPRRSEGKSSGGASVPASREPATPLVDTRVIYCGNNLEQLKKLPHACIDLIYIDPPFNSNRDYEVFWGETAFHAATPACAIYTITPRKTHGGI